MREKGFVLCMAILFLGITSVIVMCVIEKSMMIHKVMFDSRQYKRALDLAERALLGVEVMGPQELRVKEVRMENAIDDCSMLEESSLSVLDQKFLILTLHVGYIKAANVFCKNKVNERRVFWWVE